MAKAKNNYRVTLPDGTIDSDNRTAREVTAAIVEFYNGKWSVARLCKSFQVAMKGAASKTSSRAAEWAEYARPDLGAAPTYRAVEIEKL